MAQPTGSDIHVDKLLTDISVAYMQKEGDFIHKICPVVPVAKQSDKFITYNKGDWLRSQMQPRARATESAGSGWGTSTSTYDCKVWALHKDIADQDRASQDAPVDLDRDAALFLAQQALLRLEKSFASAFLATSVWGNADQTGVSGTPGTNEFKQWNDSASTPVKDIRTQKGVIKKATGMDANVFVVTRDVWDKLVDHADFVDRIKYSERGIVTEDLAAAVLGVERVVVINAVENTAAEGASFSGSFVATKKALLMYVAPRPSLLEPSACYNFVWTGYLGAAAAAPQISSFRMDALKADRKEAELAFDMKVVASDCGVLFTSAIA